MGSMVLATLVGCSGGDLSSPQLTVTTTALPDARTGDHYDARLSAPGGSGTYEWTVISGTLPAGLFLSLDGALIGTPMVPGENTFVVQAKSGTEVGTGSLALTVQAGPCWVEPQTPDPPAATEWRWTPVATAQGLTDIQAIRTDPQNEDTWYASHDSGLFVSHDGGDTWHARYEGWFQSPVEFASGSSCSVYVLRHGPGPAQLLVSEDRGRSFAPLYEVTEGGGRSLHVSRKVPGLILIGVQNIGGTDRMYRSVDYGNTWSIHLLGGGSRCLIPWDIDEDVNGALYSGTEICDHPQPYQPPFFVSDDAGESWRETTAKLPWHVIAIQTHPFQPMVYALEEGPGLYVTTDAGESWRKTGGPHPSLSLLIDPANPVRLYGGHFSHGELPGGIWLSEDSGESFRLIGLSGLQVASIWLSRGGRVLIASGYESGIWRAVVPNSS